MAIQVIEEYLPKTAEYINHVFDVDGKDRGGHHNYVIEQEICDLGTPICDQSSENVGSIDNRMLKYLHYLDNVQVQ